MIKNKEKGVLGIKNKIVFIRLTISVIVFCFLSACSSNIGPKNIIDDFCQEKKEFDIQGMAENISPENNFNDEFGAQDGFQALLLDYFK